MRKWVLILVVCLFGSCGQSDFEYASRRARLVYDNSLHLDPILSSAMNVMSPGIFCRVSSVGNFFVFTNSQGQSSKQPMTTIDMQRTHILGIDNESGIFVGFGLLSDPAVFYAYDGQCPNCYASEGRPRYPLSLENHGKARCSQCKRTYDLNNGGIVTEGEGGKKLERYRASTTGPYGILSVNN